MYSIGDFSKINRVTPKALRHYDRIGLLKPAKTDDWTGYRYYSSDQLPVIRKILSMKALGFSLTDIQAYLEDRIELNVLLNQRAEQLKKTIAAEQARLEQVRRYQEKLEGAEEMNSEIRIKALPEVIVASMRTMVPGYDTFFDIVPKMGEYMEQVGAECREPAYCFTIYHDGEYREQDIDVEICEAVTAPRADSKNVRFKTIQAVREAACILHRGRYDDLRSSYNALFSWVEANGWVPTDHPRESYIDGIWNRDNPDNWLTEIQLPIQKRSPA